MRADSTPSPSFFIVGAPKCGTTALYRYLSGHPLVFMPRLKEPHFYSTDLPGLRAIENVNAYRALFRDASPSALVGEASASYLMSQDAVPAILRDNPEARFIVMLRDPIAMAHALHAENVFNLSEENEDFRKAWALQDVRSGGAGISKYCLEPQMLQYRHVCAIGDQLERLFDVTKPAQRHVVLFDDFTVDAAHCYFDVLTFLGLPRDDRRAFSKVNENRRIRSRGLATLHRRLPQLMGSLYAPAKRLGNRLGIRPSQIVARHNVITEKRSPLETDFHHELKTHFRPQVEKLSRMLDRDLSNWMIAESAS